MLRERAGTTAGEQSLHLPLPQLVETSFHGKTAHLDVLTDNALADACGTRIAFTQRRGGVSVGPYAFLNLGDHVDDDGAAVNENRRRVVDALGGSSARLIVPKQVHGTDVVHVEDVERARREAREGADSVVCCKAGVGVLLCFADCVPVVVVAPDGSFAVAHAGWRGALGGIAAKTVAELVGRCGIAAERFNAYIGPHIGACCYEVSDELLEKFVSTYGEQCASGGHLDLTRAVAESLQRGGIVSQRIADAGVCTSCSVQDYYSYRAEGGVCGRHGAYAVKER